MAKQIQLRRGTTQEHTTFVGAVGEVTVDTTKDVVVVHDGITSGGVPGAREQDITAANAAIATLTANVGLLRVDVNALDPGGAAAGLAQVRANVTAANVKISNLESNAVVQGVQIAGLTTDLAGANSAITSVQISLGITNNNLVQLQNSDTAVNAAIVSLETFAYSNAATQGSLIDDLRANITAANAAILVNTNRVAAANIEIAALAANITAANVEITNLYSNAATQSTQISSTNANVTAANVGIALGVSRSIAANVEIEALRGNITAANAQIITNTNRSTAANIEIGNLRANITAANAAITSANVYNINLTNSTYTTLLGGADSNFNTLNKLANAVAGDPAYSSTVSATFDSIRANITAANAAIVVNTNRVDAANAAIVLTQQGVDGANARVAAANVLNSVTNANLTAANTQITNIRNVVSSNGNVYTSNAVIGNLYLGDHFFANGAQFIANSSNWVYVVESPDNNTAYNIPYIGSDLNSTAVSDSYKQLYSDTNTLTFNPGTNTLTSGNISTSSNAQATSTTTGALRITGGASIAVGNLYIGGSAGRSITATGNIVVTGDASTAANTGALVVAGGVGISGNVNIGTSLGLIGSNDQAFRMGVNSQGQLEFVPNQVASVTNGVPVLIIDDDAGAIWANIAFVSNSNLSITAATNSLSSSTGALQVTGGAGIGGSLYTAGNIVTESTTASTDTATGALVIAGGAGIAGAINIGSVGKIAGNLVITSTTNTTSTTTGALVIAGGAGIANSVIAGGNIVAASGTESTNATTGALVVTGGVGIANRLNVGGNIVALATTPSTNSTTGALVVAGGVGIAGTVIAGGNIVASAATASLNTSTGALVVTGGAGIGGALQVGGNTVLGSGTATSSTTTGALVVSGGIGLSGDIVAGGAIEIAGNILSTSGQIKVNTGTESTSTTTGALVVTGGVGISNRLNVGGNVVIDNNATSTNSTTGALVVTGGVGIGGNLVVAGNLSVGGGSLSSFVAGMDMVNSTDSTSGHYVKLATIPVMQAADMAEVVISCLVTGRYLPAVEAYRVFVRAVGSSATGAVPQLYVESLLNNQAKATFDASDFVLSYNGSTYAAYDLYYQFNDANQRLFAKFDLVTSEDTTYTGNYWQLLSSQTTSASITSLGVTLTGIEMGKSVSNLVVSYSATVISANTSTSTGTGALVVAGGVGIGDRLNVGGNVVVSSGTSSASTSTGALVVSGGVGVSGNIIVAGNIISQSSFTTQIAAGTTGTRPGVPAVGMIRYNTTLQSYEGYGAGAAWSSLGGVKSVSGDAYISAELSAASGDDVLRFYSGSAGPSQQVAYMSASNVGIIINTAATSSSTGALQVSGGIGLVGNLYSGGNVYTSSRIGFTFSANATSVVYQQYNQATNSLDTVFG